MTTDENAAAPAGPAGPFRHLQARWRSALAAAFGLSAQTFRPAAPAAPLDGTDAGLWAYLDALPADAPGHAGRPLFSAEFEALTSRLELGRALLEDAIGAETYAAWSVYLEAQQPQPAPDQLAGLFRQWASIYAPSAVAPGLSAMSEAALLARDAAGGGGGADFVGGYEALAQTLAVASSCSFSFSFEAERTPAGRPDAAPYPAAPAAVPAPPPAPGPPPAEPDGLWLGNSDSRRLGRLFASGGVEVKASFGACLVWVSTPGSWYSSSLMNVAYGSRESPPWQPAPGPGWEHFFGPAGSLRSLVASVAVADSAQITVTSGAAFGEADRQLILAGAGLGLWPLYAGPDGGAVTTQVSFDESGSMTAEVASVRGRPLVVGANLLAVAVYLGRSRRPA